MSRAYRVQQVRASARVEGGDSLALSLRLLDILQASEMNEILRDELLSAGWSAGPAGELSTTLAGGGVASLSRDGSEVTMRLSESREVTVEGADRAAASEALREASARVESRAKERAAAALDAQEPALRAAVGEVVQRVYVRALKLRASRMGAVESVDERLGDDGELELTIKVRV